MEYFKEYKPGPIRFIELWESNDWKIKFYGIYEHESMWKDSYLKIAKDLAGSELAKVMDNNYRIGFITIHVAAMFNQIIIDWWANENELRHLVFKAEASTPEEFKNITSSGEALRI